MEINTANILTLLRLVLLPFIILLMFVKAPWAAWTCLILYIIGAASDWFDGWVARRYNQVSEFGVFMDPISDKIFVVTILLVLVATDRVTGVWVLAIIIILIREFLVAGLREFLGPKGVKLPVIKLAKWKTATQMVATGALIVAPVVTGGHIIGLTLLAAAAILTVITGWKYLQTAWPHVSGKI